MRGRHGASTNALINGWWQQAAGQGIAVTVSTGDTGSASCDGDTAKTSTIARLGLSVSGFASTPYNIAVGGTDFYGLESSFSTYVYEPLGTAGSPTYYRTVLGGSYYIRSRSGTTRQQATFSPSPIISLRPANTPVSSPAAAARAVVPLARAHLRRLQQAFVADGRWYSSGGSIGRKRERTLFAGCFVDVRQRLRLATWLICDNSSGKNFGGTTVTLNCSNIAAGDFDGYGGTSTAAPAFAGILAMVQHRYVRAAVPAVHVWDRRPRSCMPSTTAAMQARSFTM